MYAERLTKEELLRDGISMDILDNELKVFRWGKEIQPIIIPNKTTEPYLGITIYKYDSEGNKIIITDTKRKSWKEHYVCRTVGLHRAVYAWFYNEVPQGYVVDHKNNKHSFIEDYLPEKLQLLTPAANLKKERVESTKEIKCKLNKPRKFYEDKLSFYEEQYKTAKLNKDADLCHKLRTNISQVRARLRYWDNHKEEYVEEQIKISKKTEKAEQLKLKYLTRDTIEYFIAKYRSKNRHLWHTWIDIRKKYKQDWYSVYLGIQSCIEIYLEKTKEN